VCTQINFNLDSISDFITTDNDWKIVSFWFSWNVFIRCSLTDWKQKFDVKIICFLFVC
jgi:hypothetical protein